MPRARFLITGNSPSFNEWVEVERVPIKGEEVSIQGNTYRVTSVLWEPHSDLQSHWYLPTVRLVFAQYAPIVTPKL